MINRSLTNKNKLSLSTSPAFTIVELLVVIVIIGILAAIVIVSYIGISQRAIVASLVSDLNNSSKQLKLYQITNSLYPTTLSASNCPATPVIDNKLCLKPSANNTFTYTSTGNTFILIDTNTNGTKYQITDGTEPTAVVASSLDPANWQTIGTQTWAKANLNVGTRIAVAINQTNNGGTNIIEKYCYGDTDAGCTNTDSNGIVYGGLYQWDEAMQYVTTEGAQGICPTGSHIPTDNDWIILEVQLGMTQGQADIGYDWRGTDQGTKLKSGGSSGLNMPLAGDGTVGYFNDLSWGANLWSSSESSPRAWSRYLSSGRATVWRAPFAKYSGFSVRCLGN